MGSTRSERLVKILIATRNEGKRREYVELLAMPGVGLEQAEWITLDEAGIQAEVEETGETFEENARLKAAAYARQSGLLTLADDSGLEVDALGGAPGVQSARYAGPGASDSDRYLKLLQALEGVPPEERGARFVCVVAVCAPDGEMHTAEGRIEGRIAYESRGTHGFGYDPIFYVPGLRMTMAEAGSEIKNRLSHRARALEAIRPTLAALVERLAGEDQGR
jgi:XTP/dITP diphosphohydrolase